jgi:hypothetical protein
MLNFNNDGQREGVSVEGLMRPVGRDRHYLELETKVLTQHPFRISLFVG